MKGKVVFLYDFTGISATPWIEAGYQCWIFDGQHPPGITKEGLLFKVGMWLDRDEKTISEIVKTVGPNVIFVGGYPECTDLAVSGSRHFKAKLEKDPDCQHIATERAKLVEDVANHYGCPWFAENPISVLSSLWRKPDYIFHPWEYGGYLPEEDVHPTYPEYIAPRDAYPKRTCLWTGNGFKMPDKIPVEVPFGYSQQYKKLGGRSLKTKNIRSATPRGFARAVYQFNSKE